MISSMLLLLGHKLKSVSAGVKQSTRHCSSCVPACMEQQRADLGILPSMQHRQASCSQP